MDQKPARQEPETDRYNQFDQATSNKAKPS